MKSLFALTGLCMALVLGSATATAATVSYDFSVSGNAGTGMGTFQFDGATGSRNRFGEVEFALTAFRFKFGGGSFALADLSPAFAVFDGSTLLGLDAGASSGAFSLLPAVGTNGAFLATAAQRSSNVGFSLNNGGGNAVPEPGTLALALAAAGVGVVLRRRRVLPVAPAPGLT